MLPILILLFHAALLAETFAHGRGFLRATDASSVRVGSGWTKQAWRGASEDFLATNGMADLEVTFSGRGLVLVLGSHGLPFSNLGAENLAAIHVSVDGAAPVVIHPQREDRDVVVARKLPAGSHKVRVEVRPERGRSGARVAGFRVLRGGEGGIAVQVHGEANRFLTDVRAVVRQGSTVVREELTRNWLTGQCRFAGLAPGRYSLELIASGWQTFRRDDILVEPDRETTLEPVFLRRTAESTRSGFEYPHAGQPAIRKAGESFAARAQIRRSRAVFRLRRQVGPARITRTLVWAEDKARFYDGWAEGTLTIPDGTPPGLYDLVVEGEPEESERRRARLAARAVQVVEQFPRDPVFVTFGHLDTWGQEAAEYVEKLSEVSNLIGADMVLISNEVNAAYASGALARLDMPYLINFGNHRVSGWEEWYGRPAAMVDLGPDFSILNYTYPWHGDVSHAETLLASRRQAACRIINSFESDAPLDLLNRNRITYLHDAHGEGPRIMTMGDTPTQRAGKENSSSFRVVRFSGCRPVSFTYAGHATAPIPLSRTRPAPLRVAYSEPTQGTSTTLTAILSNEWAQAFPNARAVFVMPSGEYRATGGRLESAVASDDDKYRVVTVRVDVPASGSARVTVSPADRP